MKSWIEQTKINVIPRLTVGILVSFFIYQGIVSRQQDDNADNTQLLRVARASLSGESQADFAELTLQLAQTNPQMLLQWSLEKCQQRIQDYSVTLEKQERIKGKLKKIEYVDVLFKQKPYSVLMRWTKNAGSIDKLLYVEGNYDNKMIVHPTGLLAWIKSARRDPRCEQAKKSSLRTCDQFGFERLLQSVIEVNNLASQNDDLEFKYIGKTTVDDRQCLAIERILPEGKNYPCARFVIVFDLDFGLPVKASSYDWQNNLISQYIYKNVQLNVGLADVQFTPKTNNL